MVVVAHQAVRREHPVEPLHRLRQGLDETPMIRFIKVDPASPVTTRGHGIQRPWILRT